MEKFHEYDVQGDEDWQGFYLGIQIGTEGTCPREEPIIIDTVKADNIKICLLYTSDAADDM
eukprot:2940662-Prorocentrum_lima.AAC.1